MGIFFDFAGIRRFQNLILRSIRDREMCDDVTSGTDFAEKFVSLSLYLLTKGLASAFCPISVSKQFARQPFYYMQSATQ